MGYGADAARSAYDLAFQVSPIILNKGIVSTSFGQMLPVIGLTGQLAAFSQGVVTQGLSLNDFYARFVPIPGGTVINNAVGTYPFANQQVAGNAYIEEPLNISLEMIAPVNTTGGYLTKLAIFTALRNAFVAHIQAGGTFHVATPAYLYLDCLMTAMTDVTDSDTHQQQVRWQIDFVKPLVSQSDANVLAGALNAKMQQMTNGSPQLTSALNSGPTVAAGGPVQGALQSIGNMAGVVNRFLSQ